MVLVMHREAYVPIFKSYFYDSYNEEGYLDRKQKIHSFEAETGELEFLPPIKSSYTYWTETAQHSSRIVHVDFFKTEYYLCLQMQRYENKLHAEWFSYILIILCLQNEIL